MMSTFALSPLAESLLILLGMGAVGGFLSGLLGVGGGVIFVPAFYFCFIHYGLHGDHIMHVAIATSLAIVLVTAGSSAYWHNKKGTVDFATVKRWAPFSVIGVAAGTALGAQANTQFLQAFFASTLLAIAAWVAFEKDLPEGRRPLPLWLQCLGAGVAGTISALVGIGGATMNIPLMVYNGLPMKSAVGTGALLGVVIAAPGIIGYIIAGLPHQADLPPYSLGYLNLAALAVAVPATLVLSPLGVAASHALSRTALRRIFASLVVLVSIHMFMGL